jgi:putative endonuclease
MDKRKAGNIAEDIAVRYIEELGYQVIKKNFTFGKVGEIDIISEFQGTLVFIEVKARTNDAYGSPESSITSKKIKSIKRVAEGYLYINKIHDKPCRFDLIAIDYLSGEQNIRHLINAM